MILGATVFVATGLVAVGNAFDAWDKVGWNSPRQLQANYVSRAELSSLERQLNEHIQQFADVQSGLDQMTGEVEGLADQLRAYTFIDRRLRNLLRAQCMGTDGLEPNIADWLEQWENAVGTPYEHPGCEELLQNPAP